MDIIKFNYLLNRALTDKESFSTLYKYYYPRIILHVKRTYPKVDAEEIAQEFFLNLLKRKSVKIIKNPASWVYTSCKNIIIKNHSKLSKEIPVSCEESEAPFIFLMQVLKSEQILENKEEIENIFNTLEDETTRKIFYLYYWEAYNFREIAEILKIKVPTVKQKHRRAIKKIKEKLVSDSEKFRSIIVKEIKDKYE